MLASQPEAHPVPSQSMIDGIVNAICDRPGDAPGKREFRTRDVIRSLEGFAARDPMELMFAGLAVIHAHLIEDTAHDLLGERDAKARAKMQSSITSLDRAMMGHLREFRLARKRPLPASEDAAASPGRPPVPEIAPQPEIVPQPDIVPQPEIMSRPMPGPARGAAGILADAHARIDAATPKTATVGRVTRPRGSAIGAAAAAPALALLPPDRRTATSAAAILAASEPPTILYVVTRNVIRPRGQVAPVPR